MKNLLLFTIFLISSIGWMIPQDNPTIYAYRNRQFGMGNNFTAGPIRFNANSIQNTTLIDDQTTMGRIYAGEYCNYKWYAIEIRQGTQSTVDNLVEIDLNTGKRKIIAKAGQHMFDMAYDHTTGTMFGIINSNEALAKIDLKTGKVTKIADFTNPANTDGRADPAMAIACSLEGQLYVVALDYKLHKVNKETGAYETVGDLGVGTAFTQTMGFDHKTGVIYWYNAGNGNLYTINIANGNATAIGKIGNDDTVGSLFIPFTNAPEGAPDRVTGKSAQSDYAGANRVTLEWTNPTIDAQGKTLTNLSKIYIFRDDNIIETINVDNTKIGQKQTYTDTSVSAGKHSYNIVCENANGLGGMDDDELIVYVGDDIPGTIRNLVVAQEDSKAVLSWNVPNRGATDGKFEVSSITGYTIIRTAVSNNSDYTINITDPNTLSYTDNISTHGKYYYKIYAKNNVGDGIPVISPTVLIKPKNWIIMDQGTFYVSNGKFYDTGGPSGNYRHDERITMTLFPEWNNRLRISFTNLNIDDYGDTLYVYNGPDRNAPLIGKYNSTIIPDVLKNLTPKESITFHFQSDVAFAASGWEADVTAYSVTEKDLSLTKFVTPNILIADVSADFSVEVKNIGRTPVSASDYTVQILDENDNMLTSVNGVALDELESSIINISYTPTQKGALKLKAKVVYEADGDQTNNTSELVSLDIEEKGSQYVIVGEGPEDGLIGMFPISTYSKYSYAQMMVPASRINLTEGKIKQISFVMNASASSVPMNIKVWMSETNDADLSAGNRPVSGMAVVYEGTSKIDIGMTEWVIKLNTPFEYKGKNLIVSIQKGSSVEGAFTLFKNIITTGIKYAWATDGTSAVDPNAIMGEYSNWDRIPYLRMIVNPISGTGISEEKAEKIRIYPNPFIDYIYVEGASGNTDVKITDISGKTVLDKSADSNQIDVSSLSPGIYIVSVKTADGDTYIQKMIKK
ncbi:MAG: T9SS type A sorting domain-containing protein [Dysgonomonas sp.]